MERQDIVEKLTGIFKSIFGNASLELKEEMTANDVENWDSLSHMQMISEVEKEFDIKFKLKDLNKMKQVGNLIDIIKSKLG